MKNPRSISDVRRVRKTSERVFSVVEKREENEVFREWREWDISKGEDFEICRGLEERLLKLLEVHAAAVVWQVFHDKKPDVVQEILQKAWKGMKGFKGNSLFSTWFHAVALNTARTWLRREIEARKRVGDVEELISRDRGVDEGIELDRMIKKLKPEDQDFVGDKLSQMLEGEMAEKYGLTPEGVRSRWHRIKSRMRRG